MSDDVIGIAVTTGVGKALRALVIAEGVDVAPQFTIVPLEIDKMREVMRTQETFTMSECIVTVGGEDHHYVMMHTAPMCGDSSLCRGQVSAVDVKGNPVMRGPFMLLGGVMGNLEGLTDEDESMLRGCLGLATVMYRQEKDGIYRMRNSYALWNVTMGTGWESRLMEIAERFEEEHPFGEEEE